MDEPSRNPLLSCCMFVLDRMKKTSMIFSCVQGLHVNSRTSSNIFANHMSKVRLRSNLNLSHQKADIATSCFKRSRYVEKRKFRSLAALEYGSSVAGPNHWREHVVTHCMFHRLFADTMKCNTPVLFFIYFKLGSS
jgi:hypothetical protein